MTVLTNSLSGQRVRIQAECKERKRDKDGMKQDRIRQYGMRKERVDKIR